VRLISVSVVRRLFDLSNPEYRYQDASNLSGKHKGRHRTRGLTPYIRLLYKRIRQQKDAEAKLARLMKDRRRRPSRSTVLPCSFFVMKKIRFRVDQSQEDCVSRPHKRIGEHARIAARRLKRDLRELGRQSPD